jgi:tRNA threonylcarbamoyladenosine modification (KEOPS) complex Cgi121 subunit
MIRSWVAADRSDQPERARKKMTNAQIFEACRVSKNEQVYYAHILAIENAGFNVSDRFDSEMLAEYVRHLDGVLLSGEIESDGIEIIRAMGV